MSEEVKDIWEKSILKNCSPADLLSDIDGVVMGRYLSITENKKGKKVSELLKEYYLQENNCDLISNRISLFAKEIGLGERLEQEEAFIKRYTEEVIDSAKLFIASKIGTIVENFDFTIFTDKSDILLSNKAGIYILNNFINALKYSLKI